jgi:hypothetical protein
LTLSGAGFCSHAQRSSGAGAPEQPYTVPVAAKGKAHTARSERKRMGGV